MSSKLFTSLPRHLAIIMDGNGRWAESRGLIRLAGHRRGADAVRTTVTHCRKLGIKVLTLFAFSSQNWARPSLEVHGLMTLLSTFLNSERATILDNGIRLTTIGETKLLPEIPRRLLDSVMRSSSSNTEMTLCLSLSYGGREEIVSMARNIAQRAALGEIDPNAVDETTVNDALWSAGLGPVDLMIRTSGELRISNFLLWSLAYSELYFTEKMWPDFCETDIDEAIEVYNQRQRRFGAVL